jgi:hypothetical protein
VTIRKLAAITFIFFGASAAWMLLRVSWDDLFSKEYGNASRA